ncbi:hypothetical protein, partial [Pseudomonas amygdali]|uniref:hypothetical protein n=1 Tax=Pseudomonas amygdali TaxID=47877 RepID=UPI001FB7BD0C
MELDLPERAFGTAHRDIDRFKGWLVLGKQVVQLDAHMALIVQRGQHTAQASGEVLRIQYHAVAQRIVHAGHGFFQG